MTSYNTQKVKAPGKTALNKPFVQYGHYTPVHDGVFDSIMPICPPNAFKVLMFVIRKTRGWKKKSDKLSQSQIKEGTGIGGNDTVNGAIKWLVRNRLLLVVSEYDAKTQKPTEYALNEDYELPPTPEIDNPPTPASGGEAPPKTGHTINTLDKSIDNTANAVDDQKSEEGTLKEENLNSSLRSNLSTDSTANAVDHEEKDFEATVREENVKPDSSSSRSPKSETLQSWPVDTPPDVLERRGDRSFGVVAAELLNEKIVKENSEAMQLTLTQRWSCENQFNKLASDGVEYDALMEAVNMAAGLWGSFGGKSVSMAIEYVEEVNRMKSQVMERENAALART